MPVFLLSYDIAEIDSDEYQPLWDHLEELGGVKTLLSEWYLDLDNTQEEVYDHFLPYINKDKDRLLVIEVTKRPSWNKGLKGTKAFIDTHFPSQ